MGWAPDSCTLPTAERPLREAEFDVLFARAVEPPRRESPTRLLVPLPSGDAGAARHLAARESDCCSFSTFDVTVTGDEALLAISVSAGHTEVLDAVEKRATR
ncbi:hypothetical protein PSU4_10310 [Pseudonocardia sulfidoxydans NBRC 16205]|uniref:Arsenate reductase n=2 Tax=Pseudonocardia sulfidoxydans TaxID=54011 RepID=A0A511DBX5_9PSEU|nr:hypothetical protein [Pseudonocardia sulfidoxydans]GEL22077.1 hypothetical protein PSU4_10310 [Pseudonocardia sulfidoxydans NBRC 16205]